jgi:DnaJ-class molecular chaperone
VIVYDTMNHTLKTASELSEDQSFYETLHCAPSSSAEQIKTEYVVLARKYHPDKQNNNRGDDDDDDDDSKQKMITKINRAYKVLSTPDKRAQYDKYLESELCISWNDYQCLGENANEAAHWAKRDLKPTLTDATLPSNTPQNISNAPPPSRDNNHNNNNNNKTPIKISEPYFPPTSDALRKFRSYQI